MKWEFLLIAAFAAYVQAFDENIQKNLDFVISETDPEAISAYLRQLTLKPHLGGTPAEHDTAKYISDEWKKQGLDEVHMPAYDVLLSYPDEERLNYARIVDEDGQEIWKSQGKSPPIHAEEESLPEVPSDFNAYSKTGNVSGEIVYVNFGRKEDFEKIKHLGIDVTNKIVLARYGEIFRANIVDFAQVNGAVGVLLYSDPQQFAQMGTDAVYADTIFLPGKAAALGTAYLYDGDPLTRFYPAIESAFHLPEEEALLPKIPVMPLSYDDAEEILKRMNGDSAPEEWQGALNHTYKLGPGLTEGFTVTMEVNTHNKRATTYDVIGVIKGAIEPDRYVVLGNHRDAWVFGAVDPSSGTATMLEVSRALTEYMKQTGWRPRRSIVFCSWGSEEYGLIGSSEWTEQFGKQLVDRAIAYLNVDMAIEGNHTMRALSAPLLYKATEDVTKALPNPNPAEIEAGRETIFDTWLNNLPSKSDSSRPEKGPIDSGSDYRMFQHTFGIPCMDYRYTHEKEIYTEPLYHTLYETFFLSSELYDKGFLYHNAVAQSWAALATYLSDSEILPFSVVDYAKYVVKSQEDYKQTFSDILEEQNLSLEYFMAAGVNLLNSSKVFETSLEVNPPIDPLAVRRINDQMMMMERAFTDPRGLPGRPDMNHILMAPSVSNAYAASSFPGLSDVWDGFEDLTPEEQDKQVRIFEEHLAACTHAILVASKVLSDELW